MFLNKKASRALSNRLAQKWHDSYVERLWRIKVWMREQERTRNVQYEAVRNAYLRTMPQEVTRDEHRSSASNV